MQWILCILNEWKLNTHLSLYIQAKSNSNDGVYGGIVGERGKVGECGDLLAGKWKLYSIGIYNKYIGIYSKYFNIPPQTQGGAVKTNLSLDRKWRNGWDESNFVKMSAGWSSVPLNKVVNFLLVDDAV